MAGEDRLPLGIFTRIIGMLKKIPAGAKFFAQIKMDLAAALVFGAIPTEFAK